jgi:hypothetical protein
MCQCQILPYFGVWFSVTKMRIFRHQDAGTPLALSRRATENAISQERAIHVDLTPAWFRTRDH